jgi:hypothetical protein
LDAWDSCRLALWHPRYWTRDRRCNAASGALWATFFGFHGRIVSRVRFLLVDVCEIDDQIFDLTACRVQKNMANPYFVGVGDDFWGLVVGLVLTKVRIALTLLTLE